MLPRWNVASASEDISLAWRRPTALCPVDGPCFAWVPCVRAGRHSREEESFLPVRPWSAVDPYVEPTPIQVNDGKMSGTGSGSVWFCGAMSMQSAVSGNAIGMALERHWPVWPSRWIANPNCPYASGTKTSSRLSTAGCWRSAERTGQICTSALGSGRALRRARHLVLALARGYTTTSIPRCEQSGRPRRARGDPINW